MRVDNVEFGGSMSPMNPLEEEIRRFMRSSFPLKFSGVLTTSNVVFWESKTWDFIDVGASSWKQGLGTIPVRQCRRMIDDILMEESSIEIDRISPSEVSEDDWDMAIHIFDLRDESPNEWIKKLQMPICHVHFTRWHEESFLLAKTKDWAIIHDTHLLERERERSFIIMSSEMFCSPRGDCKMALVVRDR